MRLWAAHSVSVFGDMLTFLALPMLVYNATGSKAALSLTIFIGGVPSILIGPFAGAWADRGNRRRVMAACDLARAAVTIPILLVPEPWLVTTIYIVVGIKSVLGSFFNRRCLRSFLRWWIETG